MSAPRQPQKVLKRPRNSSPSAHLGEGAPLNGLSHRCVSVGKMEVVKLNQMAISRVDPQAREIVSTVPGVVLYEYDESTATWERTSVEGTLFVYNRSPTGTDANTPHSEPSHGFVILNRLSNDNMNELLRPRMEFRVQTPFVLFKTESGRIFGLCFKDEALAEDIGQLLTSLSAGMTNGYSRSLRAHSASPSRSSSEPSLGHQEEANQQSHQGDKVDIMEMLESAGRNYLNQPFSDDASSHGDSPPSEPITFTAPLDYSHQQHKELAQRLRSSETRRCSEPASPGKPRSRRQRQDGRIDVTARSGEQRRSSQSASNPHPAAGKASRNVRRDQRSSPKPSRRKTSSPRFSESASDRGQAASFDGRVIPSSSQSGPKGADSSLPSACPTGSFTTTPQKATELGGGGGGTKWNQPTAIEPLSGFSPNIARKLFNHEQLEDEATTPTATSHQITTSTLETLFSHASTTCQTGSTGTATSTASSSLPLRALSLAEIESQLKAEAPSPDAAKSSANFTLSSSASLDLSSREGSQTGTQDKRQVLLQPSAFAVATSGSSRSEPCGPFSAPHVASAGQFTSISVEPPTPVTSQAQGLLLIGAPATVTDHAHIQTDHTHGLTSPPSRAFPSIPPLMHSPGMKAAPITPRAQEPLRSKTAPLQNTPTSSRGGRQAAPVVVTTAHPVSSIASPDLGSTQTSVSLEQGGHQPTPAPVATHAATTPLQKISVVPSRAVTDPPNIGLMSPVQFLRTSGSSEPEKEEPVTALTLQQFKEAMLYAMQHNDDFVSTLHKAYLQTATSTH